MEKTLAVVLMIICLLVGVVGGAIMFQGEDTETIKEVEVPVNVTIEVPIEVPVADIEELFTCKKDNYDYDFNEISVNRVYDKYTVDVDDDDYTVSFSVRLKYDEDDERSCRETYDIEAYYEDDEDVEIKIIED